MHGASYEKTISLPAVNFRLNLKIISSPAYSSIPPNCSAFSLALDHTHSLPLNPIILTKLPHPLQQRLNTLQPKGLLTPHVQDKALNETV